MRVMYLAFEGFDTQNGTNHLANTILDTFLDNGLEVYLVSSHTVGINEDIPQNLKNKDGFSFDIIRRNIVEKRNFIQRYWDGLLYSFNAMRKWIKHRKDIDVVLLQSCPTVFFSSILLKLFLKKPIIFNYYDIFPNGPRAYGAIKNGLIYNILHAAQKIVYKNSDSIIAISEDTKRTLIKDGVPEDKINVIPNWYNEKQVKQINNEHNKFLAKYNIDIREKFIIQYAGNFGYTFDYKSIIEVAKRMIKYENVEFHMIGTGGFEKEFKEAAIENNLTNICFFDWQPAELLSDVYSYCDLEIIPLSKGVIYTSYPSKTSLLMACGGMFLCITEKDSHFYREVNENEVGVCVPIGNYDQVIQAILLLYKDTDKMKRMKDNAKKYGKFYFSSNSNVTKYIDIINKVVKK